MQKPLARIARHLRAGRHIPFPNATARATTSQVRLGGLRLKARLLAARRLLREARGRAGMRPWFVSGGPGWKCGFEPPLFLMGGAADWRRLVTGGVAKAGSLCYLLRMVCNCRKVEACAKRNCGCGKRSIGGCFLRVGSLPPVARRLRRAPPAANPGIPAMVP